MASSYSISVGTRALQALISQFNNDENSWKVRLLFDDESTIIETVTFVYSPLTYEMGVTSDQYITIPITTPKTLVSVDLIYNDGSDTYMHAETVSEYYKYSGQYVIQNYSIEFSV